MRMGGYIESGLPFPVQPQRQAMHNIQTLCIPIHKLNVEPFNFFERRMAESVFSPKDALPAPMTVMTVIGTSFK